MPTMSLPNLSSSTVNESLLRGAGTDDELDLDDDSENHTPFIPCPRCSHKRHPSYARRAMWVMEIILVLLSVAGIYSAISRERLSLKSCVEHTSLYSPLLDFVEYEKVRFSGSIDLGPPSRWIGMPRPEMDEAWDSVADGHPTISITEEEARKAGIYLDLQALSRFPPELGGGIHVQLEWAHQLHCLNLLRKSVHRDYYQDKDIFFGNYTTEEDIIGHLDHCVNILRQALMCNADMGLVFIYWVEGHNHFHIDSSNQHVCRNFDQILKKSNDLEVPVYDVVDGAKFHETMPEGVIPLKDYPERLYQNLEKERLGHPYYL